MEEPELNYIKMFNAGERITINNCSFGYLSYRIVFYLLNLHIKSRHTYFARAGTTTEEDSYKTDAGLSDQGRLYAERMGQALLKHRDGERQALADRGGPQVPLRPLKVWTSTRRRTFETADWLYDQGHSVRQRNQLSALNPGVCERMSEKRIRAELPEEVAKHEADPYHHRYPRAESYHDLAVRLEPIILELERQQDDLLIIAHESVLRVLYGYLMACNAADIPSLSFPRNEIVEIVPASYNNEASSIRIPDLPPEIIPPSPEDLKIPVPPSEAPSGNRHPAAADWDSTTGLLAYGSDRNVALWDPLREGVVALLRGHSDDVNAVKFFHPAKGWPSLIISGSIDQTTRLWQADRIQDKVYSTVGILEGHASSINCLAVAQGLGILASGGADATIKIWKVDHVNHAWDISLLQTIQTSPKFLPLALALSVLDEDNLLLAAAGTKANIYIYVTSQNNFIHQATLSGHEGWIRSLAITVENDGADDDLLLASASQDKYIRLWRIRKIGKSVQERAQKMNESLTSESLLSSKTHKVRTVSNSFSLAFEALLLGHDDWIYTVAWQRTAGKIRLLSASADSSLAMWDMDTESGVWVCSTRLGENSVQKGSTTATGSIGGFWVGLWSNDGQSVASLGRTGSWRLWNYDGDHRRWVHGVGISGHTKSVMDIAWARNGSYLLSTGSDQTTRLHAQWIGEGQISWHEFVRPQIHGYDLNCIDTVGQLQFVSGADEKLLRVFDEPKHTAELLRRLCGIQTAFEEELPVAANVPVLGLSNKAIDHEAEKLSDQDRSLTEVSPSPAAISIYVAIQDKSRPPIEDDLARHTLWPEGEKLYGHGYEISAVASSNDGSIIATACKASSLDHAVIRLFETKDWRALRPPLTAHSLTVTSLRFSSDDRYLLSTGRDRQWAVFERDEVDRFMFHFKAKNPKAHSRMILSACWAPNIVGKTFITAGRDKTCKIWDLAKTDTEATVTITASAPVTAVDVLDPLESMLVLAAADEDGGVTIYLISKMTLTVNSCQKLGTL
ncbi:MAG: hypothetical protein Q9216_000768 [Gyalolechia sp. 2 TL-2023]